MDSPTAQFVTSRRMGIFEPIHQISMWEDFKVDGCQIASASMIVEVNTKIDNQSEDSSQGTPRSSNKFHQGTSKPPDKVLRRLAQNREAARKSRLRKKAYVQQLETSRLKLVQLEQEVERARQQGLYVGDGIDTRHLGYSGNVNSVDRDLRSLVDGSMKHYFDLFQMKATAAKADVFYLMHGIWKTSAERFFSWIGGFRPTELLKILVAQLDLADQQVYDVCNLRQSCQQAEDALSQGMDKLQQILAETVAAGQVTLAMEKSEALVRFVNQADHLRQVTLQQMSRILTTHQAARGLLNLGEYCQRLRTLSSLWATRPCEPA
ncbi:transcription factor TGA4-like isoform X2 [Actinidia eriantha]|uniref:transcription factor TGA4-like isoform X2 n=1 Tax=Actinidia eriantha TaxID=165200 RepID=UPI002583BF37|nr:transcription factor TGA4-like isoform X2 [Actinidia eriantha]